MNITETDSNICSDCGASNPSEMNFCQKCGSDFQKVVRYQIRPKQEQSMSRKNLFLINLVILGLIIGLFPMTLLLIFVLTFGPAELGDMVFYLMYVVYVGFLIYLNKYKKSKDH
ncbi:MAG: zinc-ribbon domain-containing protein [Candidatus Kariarchaeaceae archaeon]|jgi:ribosomal protein L40E